VRQKKFWFTVGGILAVLAIALMLPTGAETASKYKVLHQFTGKDGAIPDAGLIFDAAGNLYGTTSFGGVSTNCSGGCGTVFKLAPNSDGTWTESVLYSFRSGADGEFPVAGLIFDTAGNLYGTTQSGAGGGFGVVFRLTSKSDGSWTESVLHSFTNGTDGAFPSARLIFDTAGNLYGTTLTGGGSSKCVNGGCGIVFELTPKSDGSWMENILHSFTGDDGAYPDTDLVFDATGNLYGTTSAGGVSTKCTGGCGTVFKLKPNSDGSWTESVLHSFAGGADASDPLAGLIFDATGNLYGTTSAGGVSTKCTGGCGTVFKLKPNSDGSWTESVLHSFANHPAAIPYAGLIFDAMATLYGTTVSGGRRNYGTVFKLARQSNGSWAFNALHVFQGRPAGSPFAGLVSDKAGSLYGTTASCGQRPCQGVVFEITP
jgi:uncharacterized repeat protein (TIGR03803 family)